MRGPWTAIAGMTLGCWGASTSPTPAQPPPPAQEAPLPADSSSDAVQLQASLSLVDGESALRVDYTLTNHTDATVYVCDELIVRRGKPESAGRRVVVGPGSTPGSALLLCGSTSPREELFYLPKPAFRPLEAGATLTDWKQVPYPLESWHYAGTLDPLPAPPASVVFAVQYFTGDALKWADVPLADGRTVRVPEYRTLSGVHTPPLALPAAASHGKR